MSLIEVRDLSVTVATAAGPQRLLDSVSFELDAGTTLGVMGGSGSGKSTLALALPGLLGPGMQVSGSLLFDGRERIGDAAAMKALRGTGIGLVFQNALTSLNPYLPIGEQLIEVLMHHRRLGRAAALSESVRLLDAVQIAHPSRRLFDHPHQFSGGMRQRVMIAIALAAQPPLLVADEPTSALDVTVQSQILALLNALRRDFALALLLISHDAAVIRTCCDRVLTMRGGQLLAARPDSDPGLARVAAGTAGLPAM